MQEWTSNFKWGSVSPKEILCIYLFGAFAPLNWQRFDQQLNYILKVIFNDLVVFFCYNFLRHLLNIIIFLYDLAFNQDGAYITGRSRGLSFPRTFEPPLSIQPPWILRPFSKIKLEPNSKKVELEWCIKIPMCLYLPFLYLKRFLVVQNFSKALKIGFFSFDLSSLLTLYSQLAQHMLRTIY